MLLWQATDCARLHAAPPEPLLCATLHECAARTSSDAAPRTALRLRSGAARGSLRSAAAGLPDLLGRALHCAERSPMAGACSHPAVMARAHCMGLSSGHQGLYACSSTPKEHAAATLLATYRLARLVAPALARSVAEKAESELDF